VEASSPRVWSQHRLARSQAGSLEALLPAGRSQTVDTRKDQDTHHISYSITEPYPLQPERLSLHTTRPVNQSRRVTHTALERTKMKPDKTTLSLQIGVIPLRQIAALKEGHSTLDGWRETSASGRHDTLRRYL
jgi:hypothetical protein